MDSVKKPKSTRNTEKRRERSKVAARFRRGKESEIFTELASCLPVPENAKTGLDKASIIRLALCDLKMKKMMSQVDIKENTTALKTSHDDLAHEAMNGFLIVISGEGDIAYVSDAISWNLGLSQYEAMGQNIFEFCHPCDVSDIKEMLAVPKDMNDVMHRTGFFRMKCTLSSRGRNVHLRTATYKVLNCTGRLFAEDCNEKSPRWFVGLAEPLLHPSDVDIPLDKQTFLTKHSPDLKFEYVDDSIEKFLGYSPKELVGKSLFEFHHAEDGFELAKSFKSLFSKGQTETKRHRFLAKNGGWVWLVSQATVLHTNNGTKANSVICLHFVTSERENESEVLSSVQLSSAELEVKQEVKVLKETEMDVKSQDLKENVPVKTKIRKQSKDKKAKDPVINEILCADLLSQATPSTFKIFTPKTKDMDSGFLMPLNDQLVVSKEEPEDLTHLAPIAGDTCVPLDVPLLDDLLESLEKVNSDYSFDGKVIEVNAVEIPQITLDKSIEFFPSVSVMSPDEKNAKQAFIDDSPITLVADPEIGSNTATSCVLSPINKQSINMGSPTSSGYNSDIDFLNCQDSVASPSFESGLNSANMISFPLTTSVGSPFSDQLSDYDPMTAPVKLSDVFPAMVPPAAMDTAESELKQNVPEPQLSKEVVKVEPGSGSPILVQTDGKNNGFSPKPSFPLEQTLTLHSSDDNPDPETTPDVVWVGGFQETQNKIPLASFINGADEASPAKIQKFENAQPPVFEDKVVGSCLGEPPRKNSGVQVEADLEGNSDEESEECPLEEIPAEARVLFLAFLKKMGYKVVKDKSAKKDEKKSTKLEAGGRKRNSMGNLLSNPAGSNRSDAFLALTRQDCEVNAPLTGNSLLLQGPDLLRALEDAQ